MIQMKSCLPHCYVCRYLCSALPCTGWNFSATVIPCLPAATGWVSGCCWAWSLVWTPGSNYADDSSCTAWYDPQSSCPLPAWVCTYLSAASRKVGLMDITILSESPELGDLSRALWSGPVCRTHHVSGRQAHGIAFCSLRQGWALIRLVKNSVKLPQKIAKIQKKLPCTFIKWSLPPWKHHIQNWNAAYCCTQLPI